MPPKLSKLGSSRGPKNIKFVKNKTHIKTEIDLEKEKPSKFMCSFCSRYCNTAAEFRKHTTYCNPHRLKPATYRKVNCLFTFTEYEKML